MMLLHFLFQLRVNHLLKALPLHCHGHEVPAEPLGLITKIDFAGTLEGEVLAFTLQTSEVNTLNHG